jgi:hypothetical protein
MFPATSDLHSSTTADYAFEASSDGTDVVVPNL